MKSVTAVATAIGQQLIILIATICQLVTVIVYVNNLRIKS